MPHDAIPFLLDRRARRYDADQSPAAGAWARSVTAVVASSWAALVPILASVGAHGRGHGMDVVEPGRDAELDAADHVALFTMLPWV